MISREPARVRRDVPRAHGSSRRLLAVVGIGLLVAVVLPAQLPQPVPACAKSPVPAPALWLERVASTTRDSLVQVHLCLSPPGGVTVASFHAQLRYDSAIVRAVRVDPHMGLQAANMTVTGKISIAGAASTGFSEGAIATLLFRHPRTAEPIGDLVLELLEVNAPSGASLLGQFVAGGYTNEASPSGTAPRSTPSAAPHLDKLSPRAEEMGPDDVLEIVISGRGFAPTNNIVFFGNAKLGPLPSSANGTSIRFVAPTVIPATDSTPPRRVTPGKYEIRVRTPNGESNVLVFTVREDMP